MAAISRRNEPGLRMVILSYGSVTESQATITPLPGETVVSTAARIGRLLGDTGTCLVKCDAFGPVSAAEQFTRSLYEALDKDIPPVTWVQGTPCSDEAFAGVHILAVGGTDVNVSPAGAEYRDSSGRSLYLADILPADSHVSRAEQTRSVLAMLKARFENAGMGFDRLVRTWFHIDRILEWYNEFNAVRTPFYKKEGVFKGLLPASTGIEGANPAGAALVLTALAVEPAEGVTIREIDSPLQGPAGAYGSSFSRAVEIAGDGVRRVLVSGTASIDASGRTVHADDPAEQVRHTAAVVAAILEARGMSMADLVRANVYCRNAAAAAAFTALQTEIGMQDTPLVMMQNAICRDDLLFEIEADAWALEKEWIGEWGA